MWKIMFLNLKIEVKNLKLKVLFLKLKFEVKILKLRCVFELKIESKNFSLRFKINV